MKKYILLFLIAGLLVGSYYFIFSKEGWEEKGFSSPSSTSTKEVVNLSEIDVKQLVFNYLPLEALKPEHGGKVFCADKIFGFEKLQEEKIIKVYVHAYCEEYYLKGNEILLGVGVSYPVSISFTIDSQYPKFNSIDIPVDGEQYAESIKKIYPEQYAQEAINGIDVSLLTPSPRTQAENYYKGKLEVYF